MGDEAVMNWGIGVPEGRATAFCGAARDALRRLLFATVAMTALGAGVSRAETAGGALVKAYLNNPDINTQRAAVRVADENVPKANAGYLPTIVASGNAGVSHVNGNSVAPPAAFAYGSLPRGYGISG